MKYKDLIRAFISAEVNFSTDNKAQAIQKLNKSKNKLSLPYHKVIDFTSKYYDTEFKYLMLAKQEYQRTGNIKNDPALMDSSHTTIVVENKKYQKVNSNLFGFILWSFCPKCHGRRFEDLTPKEGEKWDCPFCNVKFNDAPEQPICEDSEQPEQSNDLDNLDDYKENYLDTLDDYKKEYEDYEYDYEDEYGGDSYEDEYEDEYGGDSYEDEYEKGYEFEPNYDLNKTEYVTINPDDVYNNSKVGEYKNRRSNRGRRGKRSNKNKSFFAGYPEDIYIDNEIGTIKINELAEAAKDIDEYIP